MKSIVFFDTEVGVNDKKIHDIGAVKDDGAVFHAPSCRDFAAFIANTDYLCGHNIIHHDIPFVNSELKEKIRIPAIDTLYLSPLLFPMKPYHALIKDDKLLTDELNNPVNDSKKAKDLFFDEVNAFRSLPSFLKQAFCKMPSDKNVRLLAPAGSGKTFSLLWRCKVLEETYDPEKKKKGRKNPTPHFLLIAFTRAARHELESRIENNECFRGLNATVRTLNAWGWEQNKIPGRELLINRRERQRVILHDLRSVCDKYPLIASMVEAPRTRTNNAAILMDMIDGYKSLGFTHLMKMPQYRAYVKTLCELGLGQLFVSYQRQIMSLLPAKNREATIENVASEFFRFWKEAVVKIKENNRFTLEDQKYWARIYLEQQMSEGKYPSGAARYSHIMVDEFQDINPLDMALIKDICLYHGQGSPAPLAIIGDDDQAIFGWRGTTPKFILDPERYIGFPFETCFLLTNYRSPKEITALSNKLLSYNKNREQKQIESVAKGKAFVKVINDKTSVSTIDTTLRLTRKLLEKPGIKHVALIGRRQVSLFPYQVLLSSEGTAYHVAADLDIFEGEATSALMEILRIVYRAKNHDNDDPIEALLVIIDRIDRYKVQKSDRDAIAAYLDKKRAEDIEEAIHALREYPKPIKSADPNDVCDIAEALIRAKTVYEFMKLVVDNLRGLDQDYTKAEIDTHYKLPQFSRLTDLSVKYGADFRRFYSDLGKARKAGERSRKRDRDESKEGYEEANNSPIWLLTATRSKGMEFDAVIILDADDNEWPNRLTNDIEEERRLFHVAISRARKYLYFVTDSRNLESRFLLEAGVI